jgi:phage shock protein PspC (stress-responsive transcriptional regulator)
MAQRLTRSTRSAILGGVAAGFAEYLDVDPVLIRLIFIVLCIAGGSGLILYVVCWLIMPREDEMAGGEAAAGAPPADRFAEEVREAGERVVDNLKRGASTPGRGRMIVGAILIFLGLIFLFDQFVGLHWLSFRYLWPLLIVAVGVVLLVQAARGNE